MGCVRRPALYTCLDRYNVVTVILIDRAHSHASLCAGRRCFMTREAISFVLLDQRRRVMTSLLDE